MPPHPPIPALALALLASACSASSGVTPVPDASSPSDGSAPVAEADANVPPNADASGTPSFDAYSSSDASPDAPSSSDASTPSRWHPAAATTFYWDLTNAPPDNTKSVGAYDIDGFSNTAAEVTALHALGIKVVCYMDAGTYEPGRPDSASFPTSLKGAAVVGWPGELWLDVRPSGPSYATLQAIMLARFQLCASKGFDAVEADNIDSYANSPGFSTTATDQLAYDEWIATTVHSLGLAVFQKNDLDQIATLLPYFDGLLDEECNKYSECATLAPYTAAGKPVWNAEYTQDGETTASFCASDVTAGITGALFSINLDGSLFDPCTNDVGKVN